MPMSGGHGLLSATTSHPATDTRDVGVGESPRDPARVAVVDDDTPFRTFLEVWARVPRPFPARRPAPPGACRAVAPPTSPLWCSAASRPDVQPTPA